MNKIFVGHEFFHFDNKKIQRLEKFIFVDSTSTKDSPTFFFPTDNCTSKKNIETELLDFCKIKNCDLIIFNLISNEIPEGLLLKLKKKYIVLNWFSDDQWRFDSFTKKKAHLFNYCVTTDSNSVDKYLKIGVNNVILSQWAAISRYSGSQKIKYKYDVTFVGSFSLAREWIILKLKKAGISVNVFGVGWENKEVPDYNQMLEIFLESKINLNLSNSSPKNSDFISFYFKNIFNNLNKFYLLKKNIIKFLKALKLYFIYKKNKEQIKARNFEIPASFGFQLTNYVDGISDFFEDGKEIVLFKNSNHLSEQCKYYLKNENERESIKLNGFLATKEQTYRDRFIEIFKEIYDIN